jgi:chromosome segregation ATPase
VQWREAENEHEVGENMSDETYLLQRIYGLETELHYLAESSRQEQFRHNTELSRLQNDNRKLQARLGVLQAENNTLRQNENRQLQARLGVLQAENNTLRVQLEAALSVISHLEQRLKFHLKSLLEQSATAGTTDRLSNAA